MKTSHLVIALLVIIGFAARSNAQSIAYTGDYPKAGTAKGSIAIKGVVTKIECSAALVFIFENGKAPVINGLEIVVGADGVFDTTLGQFPAAKYVVMVTATDTKTGKSYRVVKVDVQPGQ